MSHMCIQHDAIIVNVKGEYEWKGIGNNWMDEIWNMINWMKDHVMYID